MSEKRFIVETVAVRDKVITDKEKCYSYEDLDEIVDVLNEQQSIIDKLDQENADLLGARIKAQEEWEKCTDKLKAKILEQQSIIEQLQQSQDVKEFSALFNQSIALQREIKDLKEENKQLHYQIIDLQDKLGMSEKVIDV